MPRVPLSRVKIVRNPQYKPSGMKSYAWLLHKYQIAPSLPGPFFTGKVEHSGKFATAGAPLQKALDDKGSTGVVAADEQQNDSLYLSPVQIGTPAQTLMLDFDTGSSDLWVWSDKLPASVKTQGRGTGHVIFDSTKSTTFKPISGAKWQISYGDGSSASGTVGTDLVQLGAIKVQNQAVELAVQMADSFQQGAGDGLLGLAFGQINTVTPTRAQTPVENMITQDDIPADEELFTAYLGSWRDTDEEDKGQGFYTFGYIDPDVLKRSNVTEPYWTTLKTPSQGFWEFESTTASVDGKSIKRANNSAIADTGTTLALVADDVCAAIYKAIPGSKYDNTNQGYIYPANTTEDNLPVVKFDVGGQEFAVMKEDLGFADAGNGMVYGGIQSRGNLTFDILGDTWLKGIYAIFDQGNSRFGAVTRVEADQNLSTPPQ